MYPIIFRFGAFQVLLDSSHIAYAEFQNVFRVFFALIFGAVGAGQAGAFAPNYTKARLSSNRIFFLLDRKPVIDGYSEEGTKLVNLKKIYDVMNDEYFVTFVMKRFHWLSLVSYPDFFWGGGGGILAYSVFVLCGLKIGDATSSKN